MTQKRIIEITRIYLSKAWSAGFEARGNLDPLEPLGSLNLEEQGGKDVERLLRGFTGQLTKKPRSLKRGAE